MQLSIFAITIPSPRTPWDLHRKFAPTLGILHPNFCPGAGIFLGRSINDFAIFIIFIVIARIGDRQHLGFNICCSDVLYVLLKKLFIISKVLVEIQLFS